MRKAPHWVAGFITAALAITATAGDSDQAGLPVVKASIMAICEGELDDYLSVMNANDAPAGFIELVSTAFENAQDACQKARGLAEIEEVRTSAGAEDGSAIIYALSLRMENGSAGTYVTTVTHSADDDGSPEPSILRNSRVALTIF